VDVLLDGGFQGSGVAFTVLVSDPVIVGLEIMSKIKFTSKDISPIPLGTLQI
jgi:hypothetical protein